MASNFNVTTQPRISVCLASYNGEKFIREQVESILANLSQYDELIICDDVSTDSTYSIIQSIGDPRIKLIRNEKNIGHVKNFEKAISLAQGDLIFLSDQDDIWVKGKVKKVVEVFQRYDNISLVYHNIEPVDVFGNDLKANFPVYSEGKRNSWKFLIRQLIKPQIFGCGCCLSRNNIESLLPFPSSVYAHDHWIAVWAAINGQVFFIEDKLVKYRQHENNLTPKKHRTISKILISRINFAMQIIVAIYRRFSRSAK